MLALKISASFMYGWTLKIRVYLSFLVEDCISEDLYDLVWSWQPPCQWSVIVLVDSVDLLSRLAMFLASVPLTGKFKTLGNTSSLINIPTMAMEVWGAEWGIQTAVFFHDNHSWKISAVRKNLWAGARAFILGKYMLQWLNKGLWTQINLGLHLSSVIHKLCCLLLFKLSDHGGGFGDSLR